MFDQSRPVLSSKFHSGKQTRWIIIFLLDFASFIIEIKYTSLSGRGQRPTEGCKLKSWPAMGGIEPVTLTPKLHNYIRLAIGSRKCWTSSIAFALVGNLRAVARIANILTLFWVDDVFRNETKPCQFGIRLLIAQPDRSELTWKRLKKDGNETLNSFVVLQKYLKV